MNDITNLNEKLSRIKDATDSIRNTLGMTTSDVIENVASGVSTLNIEKEELEEELEHAEERVLNEYFNINLDNTTSWTQMQKQPIPYEVNGLSSLRNYFEGYPFDNISITGAFGKPSDLSGMFARCRAKNIDIPILDTSDVQYFDNCFQAYGEGTNQSINASVIQSIIDNWDTSNGTHFSSMFSDTWNVRGSLDLSHFDMSSAQYINNMISNTSINIIGFENWDISNVDSYENLFASRSSTLNWDLDLTTWYNNKNKEDSRNLYCYGMFGWNYSRPQKILIPNIKNDYRDYTSVSEMFTYDYHLLLADISGFDLTNNIDGISSMFNEVSPWCAIIVKDSNSKQELLNYYSSFKQIYTKAEYEANDDLYTIFHLYITDSDGNDLSNRSKFTVQYYDDELQDYQYCWSNNGYELQYVTEGYSIILPYGYTYKFSGTYMGVYGDPIEIVADADTKDVVISCGPELVDISFNIYDEEDMSLVETPIEYNYLSYLEGNWHYNNISNTNPIHILLPKNYGMQLEINAPTRTGGGREYSIGDETSFDVYTSWPKGTLRIHLIQENGEVYDTEADISLWEDDEYHTGYGSISDGFTERTLPSAKAALNHTYQVKAVTSSGEVYSSESFSILDASDIDVTITLPNIPYGIIRVTAVDHNTLEPLQNNDINYLAVYDNITGGSYGIVYNTNPYELRIVAGTTVYADGVFNGYTVTSTSNPVTIVENEVVDYYIYTEEAVTIISKVYDYEGNLLHDGMIELQVYDSNQEYITFLGAASVDITNWRIGKSNFDNAAVAYLRLRTYGIPGYSDGYYSDYIPYDSSINQYTITVDLPEPEPELYNLTITLWDGAYDHEVDDNAYGPEFVLKDDSGNIIGTETGASTAHFYDLTPGLYHVDVNADPLDETWEHWQELPITLDYEIIDEDITDQCVLMNRYSLTINVYDSVSGEMIEHPDLTITEAVNEDWSFTGENSITVDVDCNTAVEFHISCPGYIDVDEGVSIEHDDSYDVYLEPEEEIE